MAAPTPNTIALRTALDEIRCGSPHGYLTARRVYREAPTTGPEADTLGALWDAVLDAEIARTEAELAELDR